MIDLDDVLVKGLNEQQARVVLSHHTRMLVIAGAGAGKTAVLTRRVVRLIARGVPPEMILAVTFTKKAAEEMTERIAALLAEHLPGARPPEIRTLHAWGAKMIRRYAEHFALTGDFTIYDEVDKADVVRMIARERGHRSADKAKIQALLADAAIRAEYARRLTEGNAIDFDMIEAYTLRLLREHPDVQRRWVSFYRHVLVDEYQDTNLAQVAIVQGIAPDNLFVVGDDRQSIYRFRGAEVKTIVEHARDAAFEVHELTMNYRSVPGIVAWGNGCVDGDRAPMVSGRVIPTVHYSDWAAQPDVHLACGRFVQPAWVKTIAVPPPGVHEGTPFMPRPGEPASDEPTLYAFDAPRVTCPACIDAAALRVPPAVRAFTYRSEPVMITGLVLAEHDDGTPWRDIAILGRNWAALEEIRDGLNRAGVPVNFCGADEDPWVTEDGRAIARAIQLAHNPDDNNLALLLSEWGAMGRRRFTDYGATRAAALRARSSVWRTMAQLDPQWAQCWERFQTRTIGPWSAADHVRVFLDALGVEDVYKERGLATRVETIRGLLAEVTEKHPTLEGFVDWWAGRTLADRIKENRDAVRIVTIHGAKGLEWPVVILADFRAGVLPSDRVKATDEDRAEDLRVAYVGITRGRDRLYVSCPERHKLPWGPGTEPAVPSPYLARPGGPGLPLPRWTPTASWGISLDTLTFTSR